MSVATDFKINRFDIWITGMRSIGICSVSFLAALLLGSSVVLADGNTYMGVGSCSSSNCHGSVSPIKGTNVLQNEYVSWQKHDLHSKAYTNLVSEDGLRIGALLGIKEPHKDKLCLDCHATYAPDGLRGANFSFEDGVGCESCHGAAEKYLSSHTASDATHAKNIENGLTDLASPVKRASMCLSCHYGTEDKVVNHRLIGAGHPRLSFELDTFSMISPKHWVVDDDYKSRKGDYSSAKAWLVGQIMNAQNAVDAFLSEKRSKDGIWPEFTLMYCFSCHHSLTEDQWKVRDYAGKPGELRLNVSSLLMVKEALSAMNAGLAADVGAQLDAMHDTFKSGKAADPAKKLQASLNKALSTVEKSSFSTDELRVVFQRIANYGANNAHPQYEVAEQIAMALQSVASTISPDGNFHKSEIQAIYDNLQNPEAFQPDGFTAACAALASKV